MDAPLLKLDRKYNLPMFNGEVNAKKLDDQVRKIEVFCRIQKLTGDETKIYLASLRLGGTTILWWDRKTQEELLVRDKVISSCSEFVLTLKKQFYPLGYKQQVMMEWHNYRKGK